ncbi:MAG TPA: hypothetical protein VEL74_19305 [Thermoanaerobaculia bacterium]|nr:hypothetical protein [Thermoanaerobaculia bacterium]
MKRAIAALFGILCATASFAGTAVVTASSDSGGYELTVTTTPNAEKADVFVGSVVLKNKATGEVLAAPKVIFKAGETANLQIQGEGRTLRLELHSDATKNEAKAVVEYSLADEVVFAPTVILELR